MAGRPRTAPHADPGRDPAVARRRYGTVAPRYDLSTAWADPYRRLAVDALGLRPGEVVLDVGCGSGLNFGLIEECIGPGGFLVGVDLSPAMLARAHARVRQAGWANVILLESPAEKASIPVPPHAVLFCAAHDILRSPLALQSVLGQVPDGARVVASGPKWAPWWVPMAAGINLSVWALNLPYVSSFEGFSCPWSLLAAYLSTVTVHQAALGMLYLVSGTLRPPDDPFNRSIPG